MDGLLQQDTNPTSEKQESSLRPILIGIVLVGVFVGILALVLRAEQKKAAAPPAYAAHLKLSDPKTSAMQNFIGATVTYIEGTITNSGDKTVVYATVDVTFNDQQGQTAQREERRIEVLTDGTDGPVFTPAPLAPGESKPFRLVFENISPQWNHAYPDLRFTKVITK